MAFGNLMSERFFALGAPRWSNRYLVVLKLAVGLLIVLLISLFWVLRQSSADEQRSTLISDVLWLEQNINFHLEGCVSNFRQLALDLSRERNKKHELFRVRAEHLLGNNPDIQQIVWVDEAGGVRESAPARELPRLGAGGMDESAFGNYVDMARKMGKAVYTDNYFTAEGAQFELVSPVFDDRRYYGALVGVISFNGLLKSLVPWWFAEKYQVRILDDDGNTLASKSKISNADTTLSYATALDPPGFGIVIRVDAYRVGGDVTRKLLTASVIALAIAVLFSLWIMRGHIQRRVAAEQALRDEHAFRKAMEDSLTVGMRARDLEGKVTYVNPAFCQMTGYSERELLDVTSPMPYWAPDDLERQQAFSDGVIGGKGPKEGEFRLQRKDGSRVDALFYEAPLIDADGRQTGWMASVVDVSARKQAEELARQQEEKLQASSRLVTMGELASTLAHEMNQPLAAIASYTAGCLNKLAAGDYSSEEIMEALTKLGAQTQRAGQIVRHVYDFVRKSEPKLEPCALAGVIDDSIALIEPTAKLAHVRIEREFFDAPKMMADRVQIEQVMLNLMRNAIEAMSAPEVPAERRRLTVSMSEIDGQARIRVIDRGTGIPRETREQLFTPFFSTKAEGMGIGLNICRSIVEFHHGRLWIEDNPEGGAIFIVLFPVIPS
ncbi:MAG: PAS domain S-box protein [Candidatus Accumulibacter sp.]|nr:PAS domain S-box protein [Accumulibacter sp.]